MLTSKHEMLDYLQEEKTKAQCILFQVNTAIGILEKRSEYDEVLTAFRDACLHNHGLRPERSREHIMPSCKTVSMMVGETPNKYFCKLCGVER